MKFPEEFRLPNPGYPYNTKPGEHFGMFEIPAHKAPGRRCLRVVATAAHADTVEWDHASVSLGTNAKKEPTWEEMCFVKELFWEDTEWVVQYHPPKSEYINFHKSTLHLWKPTVSVLPTPPKMCV